MILNYICILNLILYNRYKNGFYKNLLPLPNQMWIRFLRYLKENNIINNNNIDKEYNNYINILPMTDIINSDINIIKNKIEIKKEWNKFEEISNNNNKYIKNRLITIIKIQNLYRRYKDFKNIY